MDANPKIRSLASLTDRVVDRLASEWSSLAAVQSSLAYDFFRFLRGPLKELFDRYPAPKPMRITIENMAAVLEDAARTSANTHYNAIVWLSIRLHSLAVEAMARWRYHNVDRTRIDRDVDALQAACAELPSIWDQLRDGAHALADYPIEKLDVPPRASSNGS